MAEIINLRIARKRRKRAEAEESAASNRKKHGISSKLKKSAHKNAEVEKFKLDGKKLDP